MRRAAIGALLALATVGPASAQIITPPLSQSPTIDRDRIDRQDPNLPRSAAPALPLPAAPVRVEATAPTQVKLKGVRYEGSSLPRKTLDGATASFIGSPLDRSTLQKLADAVSTAYSKSDVAFYGVSIPAQSAADGMLTVRVVEGRIVSYALNSDSRSMPKRLIAAHMRRLMRDTPTHKSSIERTLSLLRDIPGQTVEARLRGTAKPGELAMDLDVKRKQVEISVDLNNRGVVNVTTGMQVQVGVAANGLLREGDVTRVSAYVPFQPDRYQFYTASHATPIGSNGTTIGLSGAYVRTRTRDLGIKGEAKQLGVMIAHPLIRSYRRNLTLTASLDGTDSSNYYLDTAFGGFHTRAARLGASWSSIGKTGGYGISVSLSRGLEGLGARALEGYSKTDFRKVNVQATAVKEVGKTVALKVTTRAQYSPDKLPTTERFVLGGEGAGMAYRDGFLTADKAVAVSVELSKRMVGKAGGRGLTVFAYADGAMARSYARPLYGLATSDYSLATAGGGLRITPLKGWTLNAQISVPVKKPFDNASGKTRVFFGLSKTL